MLLTIYHGSPQIVKKPDIRQSKRNNDYGPGFYCTEDIELSKEWACTDNSSGFSNKYEIDITALSVLDLNSKKYNVLNWLAILMNYRNVRLRSPIVRQASQWLVQNHLIDISEFDIIKGYRADDSFFSIARAFVQNEISLNQLKTALSLGNLGQQIVLKSKNAYDIVNYVDCEYADYNIYFQKRKVRDDSAREAYYRLLEENDKNGIYIRDLMREDEKDARL